MSIGAAIPYRRSTRGKDATGSLVFDQERQHPPGKDGKAGKASTAREKGKMPPR